MGSYYTMKRKETLSVVDETRTKGLCVLSNVTKITSKIIQNNSIIGSGYDCEQL